MDKINVGDILFYINNAVIVKEIFEQFHLVKVCYIGSNKDFYTDITALTKEPNKEIKSIDIRLFKNNGEMLCE